MSKKIKYDTNNFNKHTDEGMQLLEKSIKEVGVIESITIDKDDTIVSGNGRKEIFDKLGYVPRVIELKENEYPVIKTDLEGEKRTKAAIYANTVALKNINLDTVAIEDLGVDLETVGLEDYVKKEMQEYSSDVGGLDYEPTGEIPDYSELYDKTKFDALIEMIEGSDLEFETKELMKLFATRHIVFNYSKIADLYAASEKNVQEVMESMALVVIDFKDALKNGYAVLSEKLEAQALKEYE